MKIAVTCGSPTTDLEAVSSILRAYGAADSKASGKAPELTIGAWHDRLMASRRAKGKTFSSLRPGKAWEQALSDIFIANWDQSCWGWADDRSSWLLDFLLDYDPEICFVLAFESPQVTIGCALIGKDEFSAQSAIDTWVSYNRELLRFFNRNPQRCVLVNAENCKSHPKSFAEVCRSQLDLELDCDQDAQIQTSEPIAGLARFLVGEFLTCYPEVQDLYLEMEASATRLNQASESTSTPSQDDRREVLIAGAMSELAESSIKADAAENALSIALDEKELLHLQLDQVQEELKSSSLRNKEEQKRIQKLEVQLEQAFNTIAEEAAKVQSQAQSIGELEERIKELQSERDQITIDRDQLQQHLAEAELRVQSLKQASDELQDLHQENELLLLQLHQVQEELELYFLKLQEEQKRYNNLEGRWNRLQVRWPAISDWSSIEILSAEDASPRRSVEWHLTDFCHGGRTVQQLHIRTIVEGERPGLILVRDAQSTGQSDPLMRWPVAISGTELALVPEASDHIRAQTREVLAHISASDWLMLQALCDALILALQQPNLIQKSTHEIDFKFWQKTIFELKNQISKSDKFFRFDDIVLYREQVNPDYEHLWLKLTNAVIGDQHIPHFEFRFSAAHVRHDKFSMYPKIEFPLLANGQKPFESWYEESSDGFGPKTELRFELSDKAMDSAVFKKLSSRDQLFVISLIGQLPFMMGLLEKQETRISRPWKDWKIFSAGVVNVLMGLLAPAAAPLQAQPASIPPRQKAPNPVAQSKAIPKKVIPKKSIPKSTLVKPHQTAKRQTAGRKASAVLKE